MPGIGKGFDDCDGKWHNHFFCSRCDHKLTDHQRMYSGGCCPFCGHSVVGTIVDVVEKPMRWQASERRWWQFWRIFNGEYVDKLGVANVTNPFPPRNAKPLVDVTVFRGPNGVFSVSEDGDLWVVEQTANEWEKTFAHGKMSVKTIFPRAKDDTRVGTFDRRDKAIKSAKKWSGLDTIPTHPVPNRRAAIAHSRKLS